MKRLIQANVKSLALSLAALALFTLGHGVARADELVINGSTTGRLSGPSDLLRYDSASINGATTQGTFVLDAPPTPPENFNNLGSFTLVSRPLEFEGAFDLFVQFNEPSGILGGNTRLFQATVFLFSDGLLIDLAAPTQLFAFSNDSGSGVFSLTVDSLFFSFGTMAPGGVLAGVAPLQARTVNCPSFPCTGAFTGTVTLNPQPVPEPATVLLLATGVSGLAASVRRRKRAGGNKS
ncbi:MAG: PEP-CTERM sorting domain-containing protein [Rubrivivax sp.]|nr:PEP-CTERM sorting domain-containing protein [Pyrinomonadaceae bacterium]